MLSSKFTWCCWITKRCTAFILECPFSLTILWFVVPIIIGSIFNVTYFFYQLTYTCCIWAFRAEYMAPTFFFVIHFFEDGLSLHAIFFRWTNLHEARLFRGCLLWCLLLNSQVPRCHNHEHIKARKLTGIYLVTITFNKVEQGTRN